MILEYVVEINILNIIHSHYKQKIRARFWLIFVFVGSIIVLACLKAATDAQLHAQLHAQFTVAVATIFLPMYISETKAEWELHA